MSNPPALPDRAGVLARSRATCLQLAFWIPLAACTYLALTPSPPDAVFRVSDVLLHGLAFSYLTFTLGLAFASLGRWHIVALMLAYGTLLEVLQSFEPERSAELKDLLVDGAGILVGLALLHLIGAWSRNVVESLLAAIFDRSR
jgi:VanZ family protein